MKIFVALFAVAVLTGCDHVKLSYTNKKEAAMDRPFAKGWLPEIIPDSSREIVMKNDLDSNLSEGGFRFEPADHDPFVRRMRRESRLDGADGKAYAYKGWVFWIADSRDRCRFRLK